MFLLYYVALFSLKSPEKILFLSGARFGRNVRERTFGFLPLCPVGVFGVVLPMFLLYYGALFSRKLPEKLSSCQARVLEKNFCARTFGFLPLCPVGVFFVLFCQCFCFIVWRCSPRSCLKNYLLVRCAFWKKFSGANFGFLPWCPVGVFWCCFDYASALSCCLVLPKVARKKSLLVRCAFWKKFSGANFIFFAFGSGWCFLVLLCPIFGCKPMGVVTGLGSPPSPPWLSLLSFSFFPGGPAGAGLSLPCCSSSLPCKAPTSSGLALGQLSIALPLAPLFLPLLPLPPRRGRSPLLPIVSSSLSSCLVFSFFLSLCLSLSFSVLSSSFCHSPFFPSLSVWLSVCLSCLVLPLCHSVRVFVFVLGLFVVLVSFTFVFLSAVMLLHLFVCLF